MSKSVFICCDDHYVSKSIIALEQFVSHNANYDKAIIGTSFSDDSKELCKNIMLICMKSIYTMIL